MKLSLLKRKKVIGVGVAVGLLWVLYRYLFSSSSKHVQNIIPDINVDGFGEKVDAKHILRFHNDSNSKKDSVNMIFGAKNLKGKNLIVKNGKMVEADSELDFDHKDVEDTDKTKAKKNTKDFRKDVIKNRSNLKFNFENRFENKKVDEDESKVGVLHNTKKKRKMRKKNLTKKKKLTSEKSQVIFKLNNKQKIY